MSGSAKWAVKSPVGLRRKRNDALTNSGQFQIHQYSTRDV